MQGVAKHRRSTKEAESAQWTDAWMIHFQRLLPPRKLDTTSQSLSGRWLDCRLSWRLSLHRIATDVLSATARPTPGKKPTEALGLLRAKQ